MLNQNPNLLDQHSPPFREKKRIEESCTLDTRNANRTRAGKSELKMKNSIRFRRDRSTIVSSRRFRLNCRDT